MAYALHIVKKDSIKQAFYIFLRGLSSVENELDLFWLQNRNNVQQWYLGQKQSSDVIISASPNWLLRPITQWLQVDLIASEVDMKTGVLLSPNCHGKEKVSRFKAKYSNTDIENFYSDSISDLPMAQLAKHAWLVSDGEIKNWDI